MTDKKDKTFVLKNRVSQEQVAITGETVEKAMIAEGLQGPNWYVVAVPPQKSLEQRDLEALQDATHQD